MITDDEPLITDDEFCAIARVSRNTTRAWRKAGKLQFLRRPGGRGIRYREKYVRDFIKRGEVAAARERK
jgi:predicted site-specific integrase-resolvase